MSWLDDLGGFPAMEFPHGEPVTRERRRPVVDPYDPTSSVPGSWDDQLDMLVLERCFVDTGSSTSTNDATRSPVSTSATLYSTTPDIDVKVGDRIRRGSDVFYVRERSEADTSPFTGFRPVIGIPLAMEEG